MAKGHQRGNREAKKPKMAKPPAPVQVSSGRAPPDKRSTFIPSKPK
jgi:hypothetical protein